MAFSEAVLAIEGIHCASCVQLIEMRVGALGGVESIDVGLSCHRARVRWQEGKACLADITATIARAGYRAWPVSAAAAGVRHTQARRLALWRLFVAGFAMMQVMMYAIPAYLAIDGEMEPDRPPAMCGTKPWASSTIRCRAGGCGCST